MMLLVYYRFKDKNKEIVIVAMFLNSFRIWKHSHFFLFYLNRGPPIFFQ